MLAAMVLAAAILGPQSAPASPRTAPQAADAPIRLEDVVIERQRLEDATEAFVDEVAAPPRRRGLARWRDGVCVGVVNLRNDAAQYMADRVSDVARDLGLKAGEPGCSPNILIVATTDGAAFARQFVAVRPRLFRVGSPGMDRGGAALDAFMTADRPVRWWNVSMPTDSQTGDRAIRLPGEVNGSGVGPGNIFDYAPIIELASVSRLSSQIQDDMQRAFVVIDVDRINGANIAQLSDYVALVTLAQIDPDADTGRYDTILNLFDDPPVPEGLTGWDLAYLSGLYDSEWYRINTRSQVQAVAASILRSYRGARAEEAD